MFNILGHKGNANQNNIGISLHPGQNGYHKQQQILVRIWGKESFYSVGGNVNWCICYGQQYEGSLKDLKLGTTI
jgi:hypothetical protein